MPDHIVDIPLVGQVAFPASMPDFAIEPAAAKLYAEAARSQSQTEQATPAGMSAIPEFHSSLTFSRDQEGSSSERFGHSRKSSSFMVVTKPREKWFAGFLKS